MSEKRDNIKIQCNITGRQFARFAMYDTFVRKKAWRSPLVFALVMSGFAIVCFTVLKDKEQASLLGTVLLSVGLLLPIIWLLMYIVSIRNQIKKLKLSENKTQYIVEIADSGVHVSNGKEKADFSWDDVSMFVNDKECAYIYVNGGKAFILPKDDNWSDMLEITSSKLNESKLKN